MSEFNQSPPIKPAPKFPQKGRKKEVAQRPAGAFRCAKPIPGCSMGPTLFYTHIQLFYYKKNKILKNQ